MSKADKIQKLINMFSENKEHSAKQVCEQLDISSSTFERYKIELLTYHSYELVYNQENKKYKLVEDQIIKAQIPIRNLGENELNALLLIITMIDQVEAGEISLQLQPLKEYIKKQFSSYSNRETEIRDRIRMVKIGYRKNPYKNLNKLSSSVLLKKQITINHKNTQTGAESKRRLSPQRLTHYRDNWYLDAYCHTKKALRTFAIERIKEIKIEKQTSKNISYKELSKHYASGFGIFGGIATKTAVLLFSKHRAQWVKHEIWHSQQEFKINKDGTYQLEIPYSNDIELIGDILKYGSDVIVLKPDELKDKIIKEIDKLKELYS